MENAEEVFQILERFSKLKQKDIPKELDEYLCFVAKTGDTVYRWPMIKHLFREKLMQVIKDFYESTPSIADLPQDPNVDPFNYESMKNALLERLELFNAAPFTVQRICELLTDPRKQYSRIDKFMRAIEKNILVVSTTEPGRKRDSDENDITFADLTAKLTNDNNKMEGNATEAKENGSTEKPDVDMKDAVAEPEATAQPAVPPTAEDKKAMPAEKPEEPTKPVETKEPEAVTTPAPIIVQNDKPTEMEEDKTVIQNDKPDITSAADEAMPIEENKTEESSTIVVPNITITSIVPEENGVDIVAEPIKVTENGGTDIELKLTEEIISTTPKSPCKAVSEVVSKSELISKKEEKAKIEDKRESEDLLDEPEPKKLRTELNYATIPVVEITPTTPSKKEEEMAVESTKESEIIEKVEEKITPEKSKDVAVVAADDEAMKVDKIAEEKEIGNNSEVITVAIKKMEQIEEKEPEITQNGNVKPVSITDVKTSDPVVEKPESADVATTETAQQLKVTEEVVDSKPIETDKPSEPVIESKIADVGTPVTAVEQPVLVVAAVVEEPTTVPSVIEEPASVPVVTEESVVIEEIVAPVVEEISVVPVVPVVADVVLPVTAAPVEEEKPISSITETAVSSIEVEAVPEAEVPLTLIDAPVPVEESANIPAPLSPMQSSETTQEMDTNSNENKMDADDVVDGSNSTEVATMINKAAADDNAMEVDESVEPMDQ